MRVRAKFRVTKLEANNPPGISVELQPVYSSNPQHENSKFYECTPSGEIGLGIVSEDTARSFEIGKEYYVDFSPAPTTVDD